MPLMVKDMMVSKNLNHQDNQFVIGSSLAIGMNSDTGKEAHQSQYIDDRRIYHSAKHAGNYNPSHNVPRSDVAYPDSSAAYSGLRPTISAAEGNNRAAAAEQGNFFSSMAQSMPNLGFVSANMNMNLNHQQKRDGDVLGSESITSPTIQYIY